LESFVERRFFVPLYMSPVPTKATAATPVSNAIVEASIVIYGVLMSRTKKIFLGGRGTPLVGKYVKKLCCLRMLGNDVNDGILIMFTRDNKSCYAPRHIYPI
jgi:hypothetical protein